MGKYSTKHCQDGITCILFIHSTPAVERILYSQHNIWGPNLLFIVLSKNVFACQFHPEKSGAHSEIFIKHGLIYMENKAIQRNNLSKIWIAWG